MDEPSFKQIKLSLERPYKDDDGSLIPILFDITPEGQQIFDKKESPTKTLGDNLRRIFIERGSDFFDKTRGRDLEEQPLIEDGNISDASEPLDSSDQMSTETRTMNVDELMKMRADIFPQLFTSLGEITLARDLLSSLLSSSQIQPLESTNLSATIVTKSPPIVSVQAFNAQLTIGSKDEALRKAANVFMSAAQSMDRGRIKGEKYWVDALKVRRANWGLNPAPLPFGAPTGKGADKTSKDFLISYGLEESPAILRRQAVARMITNETSTHGLVFLHRQNTRLRVSLSVIGEDGKRTVSENTLISAHEENPEGALKGAQQEVVEQEIFSLLVREAGNLPTASARVSERLIAIDAAHNTELRFEMVEKEFLSDDSIRGEECNLIYFALHALLLRRHGYLQTQRLGAKGSNISTKDNTFSPPPILQPVIDLLQYQVFCARVKAEVDKMIIALSAAGIQTTLRFNVVGETGCQLLQVLEDNRGKAVGGEAVLRIDGQHTIRFTFLSPSSLTAHLSQATLTISSIPQLCQLLTDEVERCLLYRICQAGKKASERIGGTWFVDLSRCVGRWEGCVFNFRISFGKDFTVDCSAFQLHKRTSQGGQFDNYSANSATTPLLSWVEEIITRAELSSS